MPWVAPPSADTPRARLRRIRRRAVGVAPRPESGRFDLFSGFVVEPQRLGHRRVSLASIAPSTASASLPRDSPRTARSARRSISSAQSRSISSAESRLSSCSRLRSSSVTTSARSSSGNRSASARTFRACSLMSETYLPARSLSSGVPNEGCVQPRLSCRSQTRPSPTCSLVVPPPCRGYLAHPRNYYHAARR
jgi:hypothetical protein